MFIVFSLIPLFLFYYIVVQWLVILLLLYFFEIVQNTLKTAEICNSRSSHWWVVLLICLHSPSYDSLQGSHLHYNLNLLDDGVLIFFPPAAHSMSPLLSHPWSSSEGVLLQIVVKVVQVLTNNRGEETMMYLFFLFFTIFIILLSWINNTSSLKKSELLYMFKRRRQVGIIYTGRLISWICTQLG